MVTRRSRHALTVNGRSTTVLDVFQLALWLSRIDRSSLGLDRWESVSDWLGLFKIKVHYPCVVPFFTRGDIWSA